MPRCALTSVTLGMVVSGVMIGTNAYIDWWSLALTLVQSAMFTMASRDDPRGWAGGLGLQPPWATYAVMTGQPAFLVTGAIIAAANVRALQRQRASVPVRTDSGA